MAKYCHIGVGFHLKYNVHTIIKAECCHQNVDKLFPFLIATFSLSYHELFSGPVLRLHPKIVQCEVTQQEAHQTIVAIVLSRYVCNRILDDKSKYELDTNASDQ